MKEYFKLLILMQEFENMPGPGVTALNMINKVPYLRF